MNGITAFDADITCAFGADTIGAFSADIVGAFSAEVNAPAYPTVSRGFLALQGTGLSGAGEFGTSLAMPPRAPLFLEPQDKPREDWHSAVALAAAGSTAQAAVAPIHRAVSLRNAHPATVIRTRHRCRPR